MWKAVRIQTPLRGTSNSIEHLTKSLPKETLVVWPEASMACRWAVLSKLRSQPDLYCILMSSQASYKTLLNFKATFEDFNLGLCNIVQQIHKTIKQKIAE